MDRLNSFASSAKAKAESAGSSMKSSYDNRNSSSSNTSSSSAAASSSSRNDLPPPTRAPYRSTPSPGVSASPGLFVGINETERSAFFSLLDEYFETRPHYKEPFASQQSSTSTSPFTSTAAPIRSSPPPPIKAATVRAPPPAAPVRGLGTAKALYDYTGAEKDDLSFEEGNSIVVLEHVSDDWWKGSFRGRSGLFPAAYVQMI